MYCHQLKFSLSQVLKKQFSGASNRIIWIFHEKFDSLGRRYSHWTHRPIVIVEGITANSPPSRTDVFAFVTEPWRLSSLGTGVTPPQKIPPGWGRQPWRLSDLNTVADSPWGGGEFAVGSLKVPNQNSAEFESLDSSACPVTQLVAHIHVGVYCRFRKKQVNENCSCFQF